MKTNLISWVILLVLTAGSVLARDVMQGKSAVVIVLAAAGIKCSTLGWQFMDLRSAHWFWRAAMLSILALIIVAVGLSLWTSRG